MSDPAAAPTSTAANSPVTPPARRGFRLGLRVKFTAWFTLLVVIVVIVAGIAISRQQREALDREIRERGLALARALAANSYEPMSTGQDVQLSLSLLVKNVIQATDDAEAGKRHLIVRRSMPELVLEYMKTLAAATALPGLRNEGVMSARVTDATGKIIAVADALIPNERWLEEWDQPYKPPVRTTMLQQGEEERTWISPEPTDQYVMAVPIRRPTATPVPGADAAAPVPSDPAAGAVPGEATASGFYGVVYLGISQGIVKRAVALAISKLVLVALLGIGVGMVISLMFSTSIVNPIRALQQGALAVGAGKFDVPVTVKRHDELGELAGAFNEMTKGLAERELIRGAFGAYVSGDVLDDILANPDAMKSIGGVKRTITMVFTDVRGFTAMSSKLEAEQVVTIVNEYLDSQAKLVRKHKGHLDKYIGDAVRAVFGVPDERADDAERAVRCAWEIKLAVAHIVAERGARGEPNPKIGIGVDTGTVVAGNIGAAGAKLEYTVIGDPVGTSERCMDAARDPDAVGGQVVLTEHTYELVKHLVDVREMPALEEHGHSLRLYEMTGMKSAVGAGT